MAKWIDADWYTLNFGWNWERKGNVANESTDYKDLQNKLNDLTAWLTAEQYEIKAVMPLTTSTGYADNSNREHSSWGAGYGYSQITGMVVLAQKVQEVTDEEYQRKNDLANIPRRLTRWRKQMTDWQAELAQCQAKITDVTEKKGFFSGISFYVGHEEFKTRPEAEAYHEKLMEQKQTLQNNIAWAERSIINGEAQLKELGA